jgi:exosortase/archaeosortase family protein
LLLIYFVLDYGTTFYIGITSPGGRYYFEWLDKHLNYVTWLRNTILYGSKFFMSFLGYSTSIISAYVIKIDKGSSVQLVYSCLGYGVLSFWSAFIIANKGTIKFKLGWLLIGYSVILTSNILRICTLLIASQNKWYKPFSLDHHTTYNIIAYILVIILMFIFLKYANKKRPTV